jgi:hypothetical protein
MPKEECIDAIASAGRSFLRSIEALKAQLPYENPSAEFNLYPEVFEAADGLNKALKLARPEELDAARDC